jgi:hypothetical protein
MPQLSGEIDPTIRFRREIAGLEQELAEAKAEAQQARQASADAVQAIRALRKALEPFHRAIAMIYGEISRVEADSFSPEAGVAGTLSPKWQMMKQKLGHREGQIIDALQHGGMTAKQLTPVLHWDIKTVYRVTQKMKLAGLLINEGGIFSLRDI